MIEMSKLYEHQDYEGALNNFNRSNCKWSKFTDVHMKVAKSRCPICESPLDGTIERDTNGGNSTTVIATVDHFRPQEHYRFLRCNHKNYLLMCSECNSSYKKSKFPIYENSPRATNEYEVDTEKYLIVNPITDDIFNLFTLVFKQTTSGKYILELHPKEESGYAYEKALETIKLFGLGDCDTNRHQNENIHNCRISILENHYGIFIEFVKALANKDRKKSALELRENKNIFENYGFFEFIKKNQFEIV